jgi:hypothetical protein
MSSPARKTAVKPARKTTATSTAAKSTVSVDTKKPAVRKTVRKTTATSTAAKSTVDAKKKPAVRKTTTTTTSSVRSRKTTPVRAVSSSIASRARVTKKAAVPGKRAAAAPMKKKAKLSLEEQIAQAQAADALKAEEKKAAVAKADAEAAQQAERDAMEAARLKEEKAKADAEAAVAAAAAAAAAVLAEKEAAEAAEAAKPAIVTLKYEMYTEEFALDKKNNMSLSAAEVDDKFALSFVMPGCMIALGTIENSERYAMEADDLTPPPYICTNAKKVFEGLEGDRTYWVTVEENDEQVRKDREKMRARYAADAAAQKITDSGGSRKEGCSCVFGNPCTDKYICQDWENRKAVSRAHGWKEF